MTLPISEALAALISLPKGIDTSFNQKKIDWIAAREAGVIFAWIRGGQRGDWHDTWFPYSWFYSKEAGVYRGFYWVWDERDGAGWADHALGVRQVVPADDQGELPPCVDLELFPVDWDELHNFLLWLEEWTGRKPIIYTGAWFLTGFSHVPSWIADYDLWLTGYNDVGPDIYGPIADLPIKVVCWQQANNWNVDWVGGNGVVDRNYWLEDLWEYVGMGEKVVSVSGLTSWIDENKYEVPDQPPPPPLPDKDMHNLTWPSAWLPPYITQWFAVNKQNYDQFGLPGHEGLDIRAPDGYELKAVMDGVVYRATPNRGNYGIQVRIRHAMPDGVFKSIYAHLKELRTAEDALVKAGDVIGLADNTGNSFGSHLHFTLKQEHTLSWFSENSVPKNEIINPVPYFPQLFEIGSAWKVIVPGNFRNDMELGSTPIRLLQPGVTVYIVEHQTAWLDWWKIRVGNLEGYFWNPGYKLDRV